MNIFALHDDPKLAAQYHCDKHIVKMAVEYSQILCTVVHKAFAKAYEDWTLMENHLSECTNCALEFHKTDIEPYKEKDKILEFIGEIPYKSTHKNHPCTIWAGASPLNFNWLFNLQCHVLEEYTFRYNKPHKSERVSIYLKDNYELIIKLIGVQTIAELSKNSDEKDIKKFIDNVAGSLPPQVMPEKYRGDEEDTVNCYRDYYVGEKSSFAKWDNGRNQPRWYTRRLKFNNYGQE